METKATRDVVIRSLAVSFWEECLKVVDTPNLRYRVCVVGTPSVGKSSIIPLLIRMLLDKKQTVVYLCRTPSKLSNYYKFTPLTDKTIHTEVYPESINPKQIPNFYFNRDIYFIVDPGKTKDSCGPLDGFDPKTIFVSSPDEGHWGGSEFEKARHDVSGEFRYFPVWTLEELLNA